MGKLFEKLNKGFIIGSEKLQVKYNMPIYS